MLNFIRNTHFGRMIVNAGWLGSAMPLTMAAGVLKTALLARLLGVEGLGTYGLVMAFTSMLALVFGFTSAETAITFTNRALEADNRPATAEIIRYCLFFDLLLSVVTYLVLVLTSRFFAGWFHLDSGTKTILIVYGLSLIGNATHWVARGLLHVCDCFKYDFFFNVSRSWISLACFGVIYMAHGGLLMIVATEAALAAIFGIILLLLTIRVLHAERIYLKMAQAQWWQVPSEVWRYQFFGYLRASVKGVHRHIAILLLGYLTTPAEVGLFNAAKRLTDPIGNSAQIFGHSLYPRYGKLWFSNEIQDLRKLFKQSATLFIALGLGMLMVLCPLMGTIIRALYGIDFTSATGPAVILLFAAAILIITAPLNALLPAIGKNRPPLVASGVMLVAQVGLLFIFVPAYGALGAAWAFVAALLAGNFVLMPQTLSALRKRPSSITCEPEKSTVIQPEPRLSGQQRD